MLERVPKMSDDDKRAELQKLRGKAVRNAPPFAETRHVHACTRAPVA